MQYQKWRTIYEDIIQDLGIDEHDDIRSATILNELLDQYSTPRSLELVKPLLFNKEVMVCGAGPSLTDSLKKYSKNLHQMSCIAADGATSALLEHGRTPDIITSDLDGYLPDLIKANKYGSILIVHAHGDNHQVIKQTLHRFPGPIIGTTQTDPSPFSHLSNVGGFTDGDRAVYLADHYQARRISIIGFDFNGKIGSYSFASNKNIQMKKRKLNWCEKLIGYLDQSHIELL